MAQFSVIGPKRLAWGGFCLGFALGGFFDGILLHQILQWHHLLSGIAPSQTAFDLRFQILADGLFHLLHYAFALIGLCLIWSGREALSMRFADRRLLAWALIGFGTWHMTDAVLVHWILQLHRIRMDVDNLLLWDLLWVIPFGVAVAAAGAWILYRRPDGDGSSHGRTAAVTLCLAALIAGPIAALPPADVLEDDMALVVFRPGLSFAGIVEAIDAVEGSIVWMDENEGVWLIAVGPDAGTANLYRHGALFVSNGPVALGCLSWTNVKA